MSVVFSPDGKTLASAGDDHTVRLWDVYQPPDLYTAVCDTAGQSLSTATAQRYAPGETLPPVCAAH